MTEPHRAGRALRTGPSRWSAPRGRVAALVGLVVALAGCSASTPDPVPTTTPSPSPSASPLPTWSPRAKDRPEPPPPVWPLTGVTGDVVARPAMSIKVENLAPARPQAGLEDADVVWEEMVEGGLTRFNAVYHSVVPEVVGPIRSVRPMDAPISAPFGGLLVFSGGQAPYIDQVRAAGLQTVVDDEDDPGFHRITSRVIPHNLYGSGPAFLAQADAQHQEPPPVLHAFAADAPSATAVAAGAPATVLDLAFPSTDPGWTWAPGATAWAGEAGAWQRLEDGVAQRSDDGEPLLATNVVVLRVEVVMTDARDAAGARVPETLLAGTGPAFVASGGHVVAATWTKAAEDEHVRLTGPDGAAIALAPGNTWIELVPFEDSSATHR